MELTINTKTDHIHHSIEYLGEGSLSKSIPDYHNVHHPKDLLATIKNLCNTYSDDQIIEYMKVAALVAVVRDRDNCTVLHWAAISSSNQRIVSLILRMNSDGSNFIFTRNTSGNTALH